MTYPGLQGPCTIILNTRSLISPNIAKYRQISPNIAKYRQISPNIAKYRQISPNIAKYRQISPNIAKYRQISPNIAKYRQISPNIAKYRQISPDIAKYRQISPNIASALTTVVTRLQETGKIPGAIHSPLSTLEQEIKGLNLPSAGNVVFYCKAGLFLTYNEAILYARLTLVL